MGKIVYIMGKSSSGKDTIYELLRENNTLGLRPFVIYTTRPIRPGEEHGVQYYFVTEEQLHQMEQDGKVIECRVYETVHGPWYYFTADSEAVDLEHSSYLAIGTLESYQKIRAYYGNEKIVPVYIEAEDSLRLERYIKRERKQKKPNYEEVCRRFLADQQDFSEEKIRQAGIVRRFDNSALLEDCVAQVLQYVEEALSK